MRASNRVRVATLPIRITAWTLAVARLKRRLPIERLVRIVSTEPTMGRDPEVEAKIVTWAWRASRRRLGASPENCLDRSLVAFRYLGWAGAQPRLYLGVRREADEMTGHAWLAVDGEPVREPVSIAQDFAALIEFDARGRRIPDAPG